MLELTESTLAAHLRERGYVSSGAVRVAALGWGVSNAVFRVEDGERWFVVKQSRPQLRTKEDWFSDVERVYREVAAMCLLEPLAPVGTVPRILFEDRENYCFGMSHAPRAAEVWKEQLLQGKTEASVAAYAGRVLGLIHEGTAANRPESSDVDLGDRHVFEQLRTHPFYETIRTRRPEVATPVTRLIEELRSRSDALCHGDYSPKNMLVHPGQAKFTLVDYETAHFGDPTMDLGFFLSHLVLKGCKQLKNRQEYRDLTRQFWQGYGAVVRFRSLAELMQRGIEHFAACALARIDGTSPVDYLPEELKRQAVRDFCRDVLLSGPATWDETLAIIENRLTSLPVTSL